MNVKKSLPNLKIKRMNNNDLESQVNILKNAMQFYLDVNNYRGDEPLILKDNGAIAKHCLETIQNLNNHQSELQELHELILSNNNDLSSEEVLKQVNLLTNKYI